MHPIAIIVRSTVQLTYVNISNRQSYLLINTAQKYINDEVP